MDHSGQLKILIVDDRPENLLSMKHLLQQPDLQILTAESGNEALNLMLDHDLALVLLDVQMPDMDGFEVATLMRSHDQTRNLPIIFVTAINKEQRHIFSGYEAGAVDYLFKPVDPFVIRSKVRVFLELKKMELIRERLMSELNRANNRLRDLSENKSDFLSSASHELRTPLTVIKENCALVKDEIVGPLTEDQRKCMDAALRNCNRLADLVNDLLDLDSIESGHMNMKRSRVNVSQVAALCGEDFRYRCEETGQILELDLGAELPDALGDEGMVTQVVVNLVGNAVKFTPAGKRIVLGSSLEDDRIVIRVRDEGPGIAAADQSRVFMKFTQVDRKPGPGAKGTGLGLAISRKIADLLDGSLELESSLGAGSTFTFSLPLYDDVAQLSAFVRDGTRSWQGVLQDWTLVLLAGAEAAAGLPSWLEAHVERAIRYGDDRVQTVHLDGRDLLAVLLKTDRSGSIAFLSRLEEMIGEREQGCDGLRYALIDLPKEHQVGFDFADTKLEFLNLSLNVEPMGERS